MRTLTPELLAFLQANNQFVMADLYTITTIYGEVLRWADFDRDVTTSGGAFSCTAAVLKRGGTRIVLGVEVDTLDLEIYPQVDTTVAGVSVLVGAAAGVFDGAMVRLERAFFDVSSALPILVGTVVQFYGRMADVKVGRGGLAVRVNSVLEAFATSLPRSLYQVGCIHTLFSAGCTVSRPLVARGGTVSAGSTAQSLVCSLSQPDGHFDRGYMEITSGALLGMKRTIKTYAVGVVVPLLPFPAAPAIGTTFTAYPGCDRAKNTCETKFNNLPNFRGFPFVPVSETAI